MITYAGIDGTSSEEGTAEDEGPYQETFRNSFVNRLGRNEWVQFTQPWYLRGPFTSGFDTRKRARAAFDNVVKLWENGTAQAIFLAGYSRGGAAVIEVAKWLKYEKNIPVECLILFDPVDRTQTLGGIFFNTPIPDNVKTCIYAQRNKNTTLSRISFQNCGWTMEDKKMDYRYQKFFATHGGMGGTPWKEAINPYTKQPRRTIWEFGEINPTRVTPGQDKVGASLVETWVFPQILMSYVECQARLQKGNPSIPTQPPGNPGLGSYLPPTGGGQRVHVVKQGDWLSKIAMQYYGDMNKWPVIYNHPENRRTIGPDYNLIKPGQRLIIP
ncbi:MAG: LysM peptidoglycan-binding domain-containing protein [Pyrinomonadaceae bacterium]